MNQIKCPKCQETFKIDEASYADIQKQIRDKEFQKDLEARLLIAKTEQKLAVTEAVNALERERDLLQAELKAKEYKSKVAEASLKEKYALELKLKEEQVEYYKDLKARQSTKMIGETLEQHCEIEFNKLRATAFPNSYFEKDNDAKSGSKGDYIFRETTEQGKAEVISIMFEMKNESDTTATKHKNEDFLKELDKDRREKNCEYAVLVSLLEQDNDLYNQGIVDVSYKYPKMYVIRPQFFIPLITILKNAAEKSIATKNELALIKSQNIDITTFEDDVNSWKDGWLGTIQKAGKKHQEAIEQIEKAIKDLEKVRDALTTSDKHLLAAENKMEDLSIKRLTRKNPTMAQKFADLKPKTN